MSAQRLSPCVLPCGQMHYPNKKVSMNTQAAPSRESRVPVMLRGAKVMSGFRDNLFDAANRAGMSVNEFVLQATADKLKSSGREFSGLFHPGDLNEGAR